MAATATVTRVTAMSATPLTMAMAPVTATRLTAMAMAAVTATRLTAMAMAPVTATRLTDFAIAGALSAVLSMAPLGIVGAKADQIDQAQSRVGHPGSAVSVAGVNRRNRRYE